MPAESKETAGILTVLRAFSARRILFSKSGHAKTAAEYYVLAAGKGGMPPKGE